MTNNVARKKFPRAGRTGHQWGCGTAVQHRQQNKLQTRCEV